MTKYNIIVKIHLYFMLIITCSLFEMLYSKGLRQIPVSLSA